MEHNLLYFYKNSLLRNLCTDFKGAWNMCKEDKEKLFNLSMHQQSIPYLATAIYQGWGLSIDYVKDNFSDYINAKYVGTNCDNVAGDYTYSSWYDFDADIELNEDICSLCRCSCQLIVQEIKCPILYIHNKSNITLSLDGFNTVRIYLFDESNLYIPYIRNNSSVIVYKYSDKCKVEVGDNDGKIKICQKNLDSLMWYNKEEQTKNLNII